MAAFEFNIFVLTIKGDLYRIYAAIINKTFNLRWN